MNHRPLSLSDFKDWFSDQNDMSNFFDISEEDNTHKYAGHAVKPKVSKSKLLERVCTEDDEEMIVQEFIENGGSVLFIEGKNVHIEVDSGEFTIPRFCVKIKKN